MILIALKYAGSLFPYAKDSRAMAQAIASNVQPMPTEIVFVDCEPFWGLNLYLHCEVEHVVSPSHAHTPADETLVKELEEKEQRALFVVEKSKEAKVLEACRSLGYPVHRLGHSSSWVFIALPKEFSGGRGLPASESDNFQR
jgi:hypothetical protein